MLDLARGRSGEPARWLLFSGWDRVKEKPGLPAPRPICGLSHAARRRGGGYAAATGALAEGEAVARMCRLPPACLAR